MSLLGKTGAFVRVLLPLCATGGFSCALETVYVEGAEQNSENTVRRSENDENILIDGGFITTVGNDSDENLNQDICQGDPDVAVSRYCVRYFHFALSWDDARSNCERRGASLWHPWVVAADQTEYDEINLFIRGLRTKIGPQHMWIGAREVAGRMEWVNDVEVDPELVSAVDIDEYPHMGLLLNTQSYDFHIDNKDKAFAYLCGVKKDNTSED